MSEMQGTSDTCVFCKEPLENGEPVSTLTSKGCDGINKASHPADESIEVKEGQKVHKRCRRDFNRDSERRKRKAEVSPSETRRISLRPAYGTFIYKEHCLFCGVGDRYEGKRKEFVLIPVRTKNFDNSILDKCQQRADSWADKVKSRIDYVHDLHAADAMYHLTCDSNFRTGKQIPLCFLPSESCKKIKTGRPKDIQREEAFLKVVQNLQERDEEQTTVYDLVNEMTDILKDSECQAYGQTHMTNKLFEHFGDKIIITEISGKKNVVTFRQKAASILGDFFHETQKANDETEKLRLIKAAANLLKTDIKSVEQSKDVYPTTLEMSTLEKATEFLPNSLVVFLDALFVGKDKGSRVASIGQAMMQATRPRILIAPLQLGLGVQMHSHFASRFLNDTLYKHGFATSYAEVQTFERCAAVQKGVDIQGFTPDHFIQYSADNIDHNVRTLDGSGTFHGMGIVASITPKLELASIIDRVSVSADDIAKVGRINIRYYYPSRDGMKSLTYEKIVLPRYGEHSPNVDVLWELAFTVRPTRPCWSGFMQMVSKAEHPGPASVMLLPMIDMNSSDLTCINSTLHFIVEHSDRYGVVPVVTFDQPLWFKATTIIENESENSQLRSIVLRLGGFHTLMSFLGCIGHLMQGSGLSETLEKVYSTNTVTYMMTGKAVSRALRGHLLLDTALSKILLYDVLGIRLPTCPGGDVDEETEAGLDGSDEDDDENDGATCDSSISSQAELNSELDHPVLKDIAEMYDQLCSGEISLEDVESSPTLNSIKKLLDEKASHRTERTSQLWFMYMKMIAIVRRFLMSERTSSWALHLETMNEMLPYLAAAGHSLYTKSVHIYLQKMSELQTTNPEVHNHFLNGLHAVRRSDRYWAGLSADLVIEQVLMRSLKTTGGLTRGRGMTETQRVVWALSSPVCAEVNNAMQNFTSVGYTTSEQHKDLSVARKNRDAEDVNKLVGFLQDKSPFENDRSLRNVVNGVTAADNVNVETSQETGCKILEGMVGKEVLKYSFRKKDQAVTMDSKSKICINGEEVSIDPLLLFQRLVLVGTQKESLKDAFTYELCGYPPALFENGNVLLKANKSVLADAIWKLTGEASEVERKHLDKGNFKNVLDGGALLHKIPWETGTTFKSICQSYIAHIRKYGRPIIVFDGYQHGPSPKDGTHRRRTGKKQASSVHFNEKMALQIKKDEFLSNKENKQRFIHLLGRYLESAGCDVYHAKGDADLLIVQTALEVAKRSETILVGSDTDLLVLLIHHTTKKHKKIYFQPQPKAGSSIRYLEIQKAQKALTPKVCNNILFLHAILGCDTTSRLFGLGKGTILLLARNNSSLLKAAELFRDPGRSAEDIQDAGENALLCIYKAKPRTNRLNDLRHQRYVELLATKRQVVHPKYLPPTQAAAKYHSLRVYHQVQTWQGEDKNPEKWGWKVDKDELVPVATDRDFAPEELQKVVRCNCKSGCQTKRCSCRQHGLACNPACGECRGVCENMGDGKVDTNSDDIYY